MTITCFTADVASTHQFLTWLSKDSWNFLKNRQIAKFLGIDFSPVSTGYIISGTLVFLPSTRYPIRVYRHLYTYACENITDHRLHKLVRICTFITWLNLLSVPYMRWRSWLRHWASGWKDVGSIPDDIPWIFHWHNPSGHTMALRSTQTLTEMSTRNIFWG